MRRGLCQVHYRRFMKKVKDLWEVSEESAAQFEADCVRDGWIEPKQKGGRPKQRDVFDEIADKVIAEGHADIDAALKKHAKKKASKTMAKPATERRN